MEIQTLMVPKCDKVCWSVAYWVFSKNCKVKKKNALECISYNSDCWIFVDFLSGLTSHIIGSPIEFKVHITTADGWKHLSLVWFPLVSVSW